MAKALENYIKALCKGLLKIMSKMGISTLRSYRSAQVFEAVGLSRDVVDRYFEGTASRIEGIGLDEIAAEARARYQAADEHERPAPDAPAQRRPLPLPQGRRAPPVDARRPSHYLQQAARTNDYGLYRKYAALINDQERAAEHAARPVPLQDRRAGAARRGRAREPRSSSGSSPAPCPSAPSARRRTRRWPSP